MTDNGNILDELYLAAKDTLDVYRENVKASKYTDAKECLFAVSDLTQQIHAIEDHKPNFVSYTVR